MVSILTTEDPAALRSRAIRRLVRFVTITIIVRERESEREFHFFVCVSQGSAFFNSAACPGPSRSRRPKCLHFSLRTMLELKLKDQFVELVPLAIPGDPGSRAPRWCKNSDDLFSYEPPADSNGPSSLTSLWRREILSHESLLDFAMDDWEQCIERTSQTIAIGRSCGCCVESVELRDKSISSVAILHLAR